MEWTGARYDDNPTIEVDIFIDARPSEVWALAADPLLMPLLSEELQSVEWLDGATTAGPGARFAGRSAHPSLGEWTTVSYVVEYDPPRRFAWAVEDPEFPTATWRFTLEPEADGTRLRQWMRLGPARSGLNMAIDAMPDKEEKIVFVRLREHEASMTRTLEGIKARSQEPTGP